MEARGVGSLEARRLGGSEVRRLGGPGARRFGGSETQGLPETRGRSRRIPESSRGLLVSSPRGPEGCQRPPEGFPEAPRELSKDS